MGHRNGIYNSFITALKETWTKKESSQTKIIFYYGGAPEPKLLGNELFLTTPESFPLMGVRTLEAFNHLQNFDYNYIIRINSGAFIRQEILDEFLSDKPKENFYCGIIGNYKNIKYCSGSCYIISKDVVKKILDIKQQIKLHYDNGEICVDDVAIGELIAKVGVKIDERAIRLSICNNNYEYQIGDKTVSNIPKNNIYHYRLRSDNRELDIKNMYKLYKEFYD